MWNKNHIHRKIDKMKRQRAMYQMKEQDKTPEKQLSEVADLSPSILITILKRNGLSTPIKRQKLGRVN